MKKQFSANLRHYLINTVIPQLEEHGLPVINGVVAGVSGSFMGTTMVGKYAAVLKRNLTKDSMDFTKENLNKTQVQKRQHIIPTYEREENSISQKQITRIINGPKKVSPPNPDAQNKWDTHIDKKMKEMMKEFETKQDKNIKDLENTFQSKIEHIKVKFMKGFKDSMTKVMSSMTAQLEQIQTSKLEKITQMIRFPATSPMMALDPNQNNTNPSYMVNITQSGTPYMMGLYYFD